MIRSSVGYISVLLERLLAGVATPDEVRVIEDHRTAEKEKADPAALPSWIHFSTREKKYQVQVGNRFLAAFTSVDAAEAFVALLLKQEVPCGSSPDARQQRRAIINSIEERRNCVREAWRAARAGKALTSHETFLITAPARLKEAAAAVREGKGTPAQLARIATSTVYMGILQQRLLQGKAAPEELQALRAYRERVAASPRRQGKGLPTWIVARGTKYVVCVRGRELFESKSVADAEAFVERLLQQRLDYPLRVLRYRGGRRPREQDGLLAKAAEEAAAASAADAASGAGTSPAPMQ